MPTDQAAADPSRAVAMRSNLEPGQFVTHPSRPEWGIGQVQSAIGMRVTVTFEHAGKQLVNGAVVGLLLAEPPKP